MRDGLLYFVRNDSKIAQLGAAEGGCERDIGRIASDGHQHSPDAGHVVARVEGPPAPP